MFGVEDRFPAPERFSGAGDQLHELAARQVGATDFGAEDYLPGLRVLLESMDFDARFSDHGRRIAWGMVLNALSGRARAVQAMKALPDLERRPIRAPIVITGLHRTGTTALHKLLAVDPQFQGLQGWLIGSPMPRPPRETWEANPLFRQAAEQLAARFAGAPDMRTAHDMAADELDECVGVLCQTFVSAWWISAWSAPTYHAWWEAQSEAPAYAYYRRVLQLIGADEPDRRWLLKNPAHLGHLDTLFATFPDAKVIQTHRDPAQAVPSLCSLLWQAHSLVEAGEEAQRARVLGLLQLANATKAVRESEPIRRAHRDQVLDVRHADFHRDPMRAVQGIYRFLDLELTPAVAAAMAARLAAAPEQTHGAHRYCAGDFGLSEGEIRERFGDYVDRFEL